MPSIASHLAGARLLGDRVAHRDIDNDRGSFYLGATAPDVRIITRRDREDTHFYTLDELDHQDSIARMFAAHPRLRDTPQLDVPTRAFMAGYLTHLVMDQQYIERIYREHFGASGTLGDDTRRDLLDRVLQYEIDRREREDGRMSDIREALAACSVDAEIEMIQRETLLRWRDVVLDIASHPPTWERFAYMAGRHLAGLRGDERALEQFYRDLPDLLNETMDHVTEAKVREFLEQTIDEATERVREYLR
ncbi:MAG: hypothetical protein DWI59_02680 [Chloroflexi bacterium]|nr:MAG: hypothetical protein DWI59_02680 [Chloroflexota bacterium]